MNKELSMNYSHFPLKHIAIIMDGNGRWANKRNQSRFEGHIQGSKVAESIVEEAIKLSIPYLTLFAFSTENWGRPPTEVKFLMNLLKNHLTTQSEKMVQEGVHLETIGDLSPLPLDLQNKIKDLKHKTRNNKKITLIFALNYGGRNEIKNAALKLAADLEYGKISKFDFKVNDFNKYLETCNWPDPDLVIRTSGEYRLSNFMLWQTAYSEYYFCEKLWPDFSISDFYQAIENYYLRKRRFGSLDRQIPLSRKSFENYENSNSNPDRSQNLTPIRRFKNKEIL